MQRRLEVSHGCRKGDDHERGDGLHGVRHDRYSGQANRAGRCGVQGAPALAGVGDCASGGPRSGRQIVAFEFGRWAASSGALERDRLDVLALDSTGRLIVVELKRGKAPDTVELQALKYAALVSRFTRDDLAKVHADYLTCQRGEVVDPETAESELEKWAEITEESLRLPRLILLATEFPKTVTATVVFLHQQLGLDVRLLAFHAYRTANDVLLIVSQQLPHHVELEWRAAGLDRPTWVRTEDVQAVSDRRLQGQHPLGLVTDVDLTAVMRLLRLMLGL